MILNKNKLTKIILISAFLLPIYVLSMPTVFAEGPQCSLPYIYCDDSTRAWCSSWVGPAGGVMTQGAQQCRQWTGNFRDSPFPCERWFDCDSKSPAGVSLCYDPGGYQGRCADASSQEAGNMYPVANSGAYDRANIECKTYSHYFDGVNYAHTYNAFRPNGTLCEGGAKGCASGICVDQDDSDSACAGTVKQNPSYQPISDVFLASSATSDSNRCCGDDTADYGYITTDVISGVTYGKYLCDKDASGWKWKSATEPVNSFKIKNLTNKYYAVANGNSWQVCEPTGTLNIPNAFSGVPDAFRFSASTLSGYQNPSDVDYGVSPEAQFPAAGPSPVLITPSLDGSVSLEQFANDFSQVTVFPLQETATASDGVSITILPPSVKRNEPIRIKISGLPPVPSGSEYKILNSTGYGILVKDKNSWKKAYHDPIVTSTTDGKFGFDDANPFYIMLSNDLEEGKHLLNITVVQQPGTPPVTTVYKIYNKTFTITQPPIIASFEPYYINPEKFLCHREGTFISPTGSKNITVISATYGYNCNAAFFNNVGAHLASSCNGKAKCSYVIDLRVIGDPMFGCAKDYRASYKCGQSGSEKTISTVPPEAGWMGQNAITLDCTSEAASAVTALNIAPAEAVYGKTAECCGPNYAYCLNQNKNISRIAGGPSGLIKDYYGSNSRNNVYRRAFAEKLEMQKKLIEISDISIKGWDIYDNLEFDMFLAGSRNLNISINWTPPGGTPKTRSFDGSALDYSATGTELNKWHHIVLPLNSEIKSGEINYISFYVSQKQLTDELGEFDIATYGPDAKPSSCKTSTGCKRINISGTYYLNLVGLDRFFLSNSETNFCASDYSLYKGVSKIGKWVNDLDLTGTGAEEACNNVASYGWTGTKCCGDDQRSVAAETFIDISAGCWLGSTARNNTLARDSTLLFFNDGIDSVFRACNVNTATKAEMEQSSTQVSTVNIDNRSICTNLGSWYCDSNSKWDNAFKYGIANPITSLKDTIELSKDSAYGAYYAAPKVAKNNACCPSSFCFNGTGCENSKNYTSNAKKPPIFKEFGQTGYRCSQSGAWKEVSLRKDFFYNDTGYCNENSECYANDRCYPDGNWSIFKGIDRLCYSGDWTTRSKYIAASLLKYTQRIAVSPNDYSLYCDSLETALGEAASDINYAIEAGKSFGDFVPQMSGLCILKFDSKVIIGTALYKPIGTNYPVYKAFGFEENECDMNFEEGSEDTIKRICSSGKSGALFYSQKKQVMFYSADNSVVDFEATALENFLDILTNPLTSVVNFIKGIIYQQPQDVDMVNNIKDFNKVFFLQKTSKSLNGIVETKLDQASGKLATALSLNYTGFSSNICSAVKASLTNSVCDTAETTDSVVVFDSNEDQNAFNSIWPDLTAKLRVE